MMALAESARMPFLEYVCNENDSRAALQKRDWMRVIGCDNGHLFAIPGGRGFERRKALWKEN